MVRNADSKLTYFLISNDIQFQIHDTSICCLVYVFVLLINGLLYLLQYAPFKKGGKGTLAERARKNGLESLAKQILEAPNNFLNLNKYVKANTDGRLKRIENLPVNLHSIIIFSLVDDAMSFE